MPTIAREGVPLYYEVHGAAGDPVLLLMGLGTDAHGWEFQVPEFAAQHRVVLMDNRGVGRSGKPPGPYTTKMLADDALAVLDAVGIWRTHVVGLSMGGMIAQELALAAPSRVASLVLAATYAKADAGVQETAQAGSAQFAAGSPLGMLLAGGGGGFDLSKIDVRQVFGFLMPLVMSPAFLVDKREWLQQFFMRSMSYGFSMEAFMGQVAAVMTHDASARLPSLRMPTLVIHGGGDRLVPPRHSVELTRLIPGSRLETIEEATHGFNFEIPEHFNHVVLHFLAEHAIPALPAA